MIIPPVSPPVRVKSFKVLSWAGLELTLFTTFPGYILPDNKDLLKWSSPPAPAVPDRLMLIY
jgi:hypothetical protein